MAHLQGLRIEHPSYVAGLRPVPPGQANGDLGCAAWGHANEAVLPFYVLHETVIVVVAYFVLSWPVGAGVQYSVIAMASLAATLLLYDLGVRRNPVTRFLFGLKPLGGPAPGTAAHSAHQGG